jgi:hypothetical protein
MASGTSKPISQVKVGDTVSNAVPDTAKIQKHPVRRASLLMIVTYFVGQILIQKSVCTERDAQVAKLCAKLTGTSLSPVGTDGFHLTIYISPAEELFAGVDASVFSYAKTTTDFFTNMADRIRPGEWELQ